MSIAGCAASQRRRCNLIMTGTRGAQRSAEERRRGHRSAEERRGAQTKEECTGAQKSAEELGEERRGAQDKEERRGAQTKEECTGAQKSAEELGEERRGAQRSAEQRRLLITSFRICKHRGKLHTTLQCNCRHDLLMQSKRDVGGDQVGKGEGVSGYSELREITGR